MVYKVIRTMKEVMERHRYCDICGEEINIGLVCNTTRCMYCKKDLCEKHIGHEDDTYDDSRVVYCENCWNSGKFYRPRIEELQNEITFLYKKWQDDCKKDDIKELI